MANLAAFQSDAFQNDAFQIELKTVAGIPPAISELTLFKRAFLRYRGTGVRYKPLAVLDLEEKRRQTGHW